jgi:competence protein ComEC
LFFHEYQLYSHLKNHQLISEGKYFNGMIINKKKLDKKYLYLININSFKKNQNKIYNDSIITILSKKNYLTGTFITIPSLIILQKFNNKDDLKKNPLNLSSHLSGITSNIKINNHYEYNIIYKPFNVLFLLKEQFHNFLENYFDTENKIFFDTIVLGKSIENKLYKNIFLIWGISHYLARSGLHIQICMSFIISFFLFLGFSYTNSALIQLIILILFYFFTFPSISFFRALIMFFLFLICKLIKLPTTTLHIVSLTTIITFLFYPFCFLQLGTQLTFFTTFILALINYLNQFNKKV